MKGDEHILSVMESKEQQKQSFIKNENDIKQEKQTKELQQQEYDLNIKIADLKGKFFKFDKIFDEGPNWDNPQTNQHLDKLITDSDAIKNLKKEIMTNDNNKLELKRRIEQLRNKIEKKRAEKKIIIGLLVWE